MHIPSLISIVVKATQEGLNYRLIVGKWLNITFREFIKYISEFIA